MVYGLVFRLIVLVELGIHCILCFDSVVQQSNNFGIAWNFIYWICFVFNFNIAFWVQRFSFSLQCYGLWLTHVFGFVSYSDPFRIEIRGGEGKDNLSMGSGELFDIIQAS